MVKTTYKVVKKVVLVVGQDLTGATAKIQYRNPRGLEGEWDATIEDAAVGRVCCSVNISFKPGEVWSFRAHVTFSNGKVGIGESTEVCFEEPIV